MSKPFSWEFETFGDKRLQGLLGFVAQYAVDPMREGRWLALLGSTGCGKTHLARRLIRAWNRDPLLPSGRVAYGYLAHWPSLSILDDRDFGQHLPALKSAGLLVVDDIGAEAGGTDYRRERSAERLLAVMHGRENKATVYTGNLSMADIAEADNRIASRLNRFGEVLECTAPDYHRRPEVKTAAPPVQAKLIEDDPAEVANCDDIGDPDLKAAADRIAAKIRENSD